MQQYSECEDWSKQPLRVRCRTVGAAAKSIADSADQWTDRCSNAQRTDPVETITADLLPLCSALKFIRQFGPRILRTHRLRLRGRPAWLWGLRSSVRRDPFGTVLVIGTWNYPLFLVGTQVAQALAAGNRVLIKPAPGCETITTELADVFHSVGVPKAALQVLDSSPQAAESAIASGVDLIVLTGSAGTGRVVMSQAAKSLTPGIMELSGSDAVVVLPSADLDRVAKSCAFGLMFNGGATCIGPRRLVVRHEDAEPMIVKLTEQIAGRESCSIHPAARESVAQAIEQAIAGGAKDLQGLFDAERLRQTGEMHAVVLDQVRRDDPIASSDLFAPLLSILRVDDAEEAKAIINENRYRLAASVFGPRRDAIAFAAHLRVGSVSINDMIVPTADPRVPFGGRGESGFGVTRGEEGLLSMTVPVSVGERRGKLLPHLMPRRTSDEQTLAGALQMLHGSNFASRWSGFKRMLAAGRTNH